MNHAPRTLALLLTLSLTLDAFAVPTSVGGDTFTIVATASGNTQLAGLATDTQGNIYTGNNSNGPGIPLQRFRPSIYSGTPLPFESFGPVCSDADGLAFSNGYFFVSDLNVGIRKISVADGSATTFNGTVGSNSQGSPLVVRASDGHLFSTVGDQIPLLKEFNASGQLVATHTVALGVETMTFDDTTGTIYYAPYPAGQVRAYDPVQRTETLVATVSGTIDAGLTVDRISNRIFVGTANGADQGKIYVIDLATHVVSLFAYGFDDCLGILREPVSGDLYFLESHNLYRITSDKVTFPTDLRMYPAVQLTFFADATKRYQLQSKTDLNSNTWTDFGPPIQGNGMTNSIFDSMISTQRKFYRVIVLP